MAGAQLAGVYQDFPGGSDGKESACKAGHLGLIPGLGEIAVTALAVQRLVLHEVLPGCGPPWEE